MEYNLHKSCCLYFLMHDVLGKTSVIARLGSSLYSSEISGIMMGFIMGDDFASFGGTGNVLGVTLS